MARLQDRLNAIREGFENQAPPEVLEVMHRATRDLAEVVAQNPGLGVGDKMPPFRLPDQEGHVVDSTELLARGPLVVNLFRGHWWPYCNAELEALNNVQDQIKAAGATFVAISPNTPEKSKELIAERKLTFSFLRDEGNALASQFNQLNRLPDDLKQIYLNFGIDLEDSNGEPSWTLPVPGTYVVDTDGIIRYARADADYTRRPEPEETIQALEELGR